MRTTLREAHAALVAPVLVPRLIRWLALSTLCIGCASVEQKPGNPGAAGGTGGAAQITPAGGGTGGTSGAPPDAGPAERGGLTSDADYTDMTCGFEKFDLQRKPVDLFVVLDRSASMQDNAMGNTPAAGELSKWQQVVPALTQVITQADSSISWGLKTFPEDAAGSTECLPTGVTQAIDVAITPMDAAQLNTAIAATTPNGNGTPTGAAIGVAVNYLRGLNQDDRKYILLATDGEPSCSGSAGSLKKDTATARTDAVAAVTAAAAAGFHTFVIGVATTKTNDVTTLGNLAVAGLEPRADPNPAATKFYLASTQAELVAALQSIVTPIANNCVFALTKPPPDPENIAVKVSGVKSPQDPQHAEGWDYGDASQTSVQVYGSWCDMIKKNANMVEITYGCPGFVIP